MTNIQSAYNVITTDLPAILGQVNSGAAAVHSLYLNDGTNKYYCLTPIHGETHTLDGAVLTHSRAPVAVQGNTTALCPGATIGSTRYEIRAEDEELVADSYNSVNFFNNNTGLSQNMSRLVLTSESTAYDNARDVIDFAREVAENANLTNSDAKVMFTAYCNIPSSNSDDIDPFTGPALVSTPVASVLLHVVETTDNSEFSTGNINAFADTTLPFEMEEEMMEMEAEFMQQSTDLIA